MDSSICSSGVKSPAMTLIIVLHLPPGAAIRKQDRDTRIFSHLQVQLPDSSDTITVDNIISVIKLAYYAQCLGETGLTQQGATRRGKKYLGGVIYLFPK